MTVALPRGVQALLADGPQLSVGVLTADLGNLRGELGLLVDAGTRVVHLDAADGAYSPMFTFGPPLVRAVDAPLIRDVHLLVEDPLSKVDAFAAAGADMITFQVEGVRQPRRVLHAIAAASPAVVRGVALAPSTPIATIEPLLDDLDYVLVLGIDPGWSGQSFSPTTPRRVHEARRVIDASGRPIALGIDGGVTRDNIAAVVALGPDIVVSGSAIFDGSGNAASYAREMLDTVRRAAQPPREATNRVTDGVRPGH